MVEAYKTSEYDNQKMQEGLQKRKQEIQQRIQKASLSIQENQAKDMIDMMEIVEHIICACGGESKLNFYEVSENFLRTFTRIPMELNIFPFLPESTDNPRFHKVVTQLILECDIVKGIKWVPSTEQNRGTFIIITLKETRG